MSTAMTRTTHHARILGPIPYGTESGKQGNIPLGPCLVEQVDGRLVDVIWGASGQKSVGLPLKDIEAAADHGHLVLLD
jgi:hypothetical protein